MKIFAAYDVYKLGTRVSVQIVFVEYRKANWRKEELLNVFTAVAEDVPVNYWKKKFQIALIIEKMYIFND